MLYRLGEFRCRPDRSAVLQSVLRTLRRVGSTRGIQEELAAAMAAVARQQQEGAQAPDLLEELEPASGEGRWAAEVLSLIHI